MFRSTIVLLVAFGVFVSPSGGSASSRPHVFGCGNAGGGWTLLDPVGYDEEMYCMMQQCNVTSCRIGASWADIEEVQGVYDWSEVDEQVAMCLANGIEPYCLIVNAPTWADGNPDATWDTPILESAAPYFIAFCTAMAQRYQGQIKYYEFWNEENGYGWHHEGDQFNWYWEYVPWLKRAYQGLKAGDPACLLSVGGLDDADGWAYIFLNGIYSEGGQGYFDAVATHPYDKGLGAENLRNRLRTLHNIMASHGDGGKPLWITEWGYNYGWEEQQEQADRIVWYLAILLEPEFDYVTMASYLAFADMINNIGDWGFTDQCLRPKLGFHAFQSYPRDGDVTIYDVQLEELSGGRIKVQWQTTPASDTQVFYGPTPAYGSSTELDPTPTTDHEAIVEGLTPGSVCHFKVKSGGYENGGYRVLVPGPSLYNPDYEFGWRAGLPEGWTVDGKSRRLDSAEVGWIDQQHSGDHALMMCLATSWGYTLDDVAHQKVDIGMNRGYEFSSWLWNHPDNASPYVLVGTDPTGGTDVSSPNVVWSSSFTGKDYWAQRSVSAISGNSVVTLFVWARTLVNDGGMHYSCTDDTALTVYSALGDVKDLPDGASVTVMGVVNASSDQFTNHCYIQEATTPTGLRIDKSGDFCNLDDLATVSGVLGTVDGERRLSATSFTGTGPGTAVKPTGMSNDDFLLDHAPDHSGALVRLWGEVTSVDGVAEHFVISDGTAAEGVKAVYSQVTAGNPITPPALGSYVAVNGISSATDDGGSILPILKARSQSDIDALD